MKKLVIFDLDGTVLDTEEDLLICANELFEKFGYNKVDKQKIRKANGKDAIGYMRVLLGEGVSDEEIKSLWPHYLDLLSIKGADKTKVFDGLSEVLFELKKRGYVLTILTNKAQDELPIFKQKLLNNLPFDEITGIGGTPDAKPCPNEILRLLEKYDVQKENAFMVGDGEPDIITAINADINSIGVLWGNRTKEQLALVGAKTFAQNSTDLLDIIG